MICINIDNCGYSTGFNTFFFRIYGCMVKTLYLTWGYSTCKLRLFHINKILQINIDPGNSQFLGWKELSCCLTTSNFQAGSMLVRGWQPIQHWRYSTYYVFIYIYTQYVNGGLSLSIYMYKFHTHIYIYSPYKISDRYSIYKLTIFIYHYSSSFP